MHILTEETRVLFKLSIRRELCSRVESCGVPLPDRIIFYPDGVNGASAPFDIDPANHEPGALGDVSFCFAYDMETATSTFRSPRFSTVARFR